VQMAPPLHHVFVDPHADATYRNLKML